eukprot:3211920-Amphidinium_carterae.1
MEQSGDTCRRASYLSRGSLAPYSCATRKLDSMCLLSVLRNSIKPFRNADMMRPLDADRNLNTMLFQVEQRCWWLLS